jgi:uncharacterized CHY-type Zn-finger protein
LNTEPAVPILTNQAVVAPSEGPIFSPPQDGRIGSSHAVQVSQTPPAVEPSIQLTTMPSGITTSNTSLIIPEDDGHRELRQKLMEIQLSGLSERDRAQKMHSLMTERYLSRNRYRTSVSPSTLRARNAVEDDPYNVAQDDKEQSFADKEAGILGCVHYRRNVKLQCSTCAKWYPCRFCHDEQEDHALIRRETKNMLCMQCWKAQPAAQCCRYCGRYAAAYYCDKVPITMMAVVFEKSD